MFKIRGRSENFGKVFALITLRARTSDTALTQEEISEILSTNFQDSPISVSTTFRILTFLCENQYCDYKEGHYKKRKYYLAHHNITGLSIQRIKFQQEIIPQFLEKLYELKMKTKKSGKVGSNELIQLLDQFIEEYDLLLKIYGEFLIRIKEDLSDLQKKYS